MTPHAVLTGAEANFPGPVLGILGVLGDGLPELAVAPRDVGHDLGFNALELVAIFEISFRELSIRVLRGNANVDALVELLAEAASCRDARDDLREVFASDRRAIAREQRGLFRHAREQVLLESGLVLQIHLGLALLDFVEGRLRDVDVTLFEQLVEVTEEEREEQRANVRAVDIGIRHDHDLVIAELVVVLLFADARTERGDERGQLGRAEHAIEADLLDVQDLAAEREDCLVLRVTALLGRAACGFTLDDE